MQKRGQITVFIIIGLLIIIVAGVFLSLSRYSIKSQTTANKKEAAMPSDTDVVKAYAETCLKLVSDDALFNRIGLQGGFINPAGDSNYHEEGITGSPITPPAIPFAGKNVPFYLEAKCDKTCISEICTCSPAPCTPQPLPSCPPANRQCVKWRCDWRYTTYIPDSSRYLETIGKKISNYAEVEFNKCFNKNN